MYIEEAKPMETPYEINLRAQRILDEILNHPDKRILIEKPPTLKAEMLDIVLPDGRGARFTKDGKEMIGFLEPKETSKEDFRIMIADVPDKEEPVCEIYYKNFGWVQISAEVYNEFVIAFCNKDEANYWEFPHDEAIKVLQEAKECFAKFQRIPEDQARYEARMKELENWKPTPEEQADYEAKIEAQRKKWYGNENTK